MSFLLDANVLSDLRKPHAHPALRRWFASQAADELFLSVVTVGELRQGVEQLRRREADRAAILDQWLTELLRVYGDHVLPIDREVADRWGRLRVMRSLPVVDALVAATAHVHGLAIVTRNEKDFAGLNLDIINPSRA